MTGNSVLLDTNIVIGLFKGDKTIKAFLKTRESIFIPIAVLAELYLGAYRSANSEKHLKQIKNFLTVCIVLIADENTAEKYAVVKTALFTKGTPIPENDIWIAATGLQHSLSLYTNDKHFEKIDNLVLK